MSLIFDDTSYSVHKLEWEDVRITYRAFTHIPYVEKPVDELQKLSIFAPEAYFEGESINGYSLKTAPIFFPNTVGGYMPGYEDKPVGSIAQGANTMARALARGYVVVSAGLRGRCMKDAEGKNIGCAPAVIYDLKAVVRYLRLNKERIPGDVEKIISNGTSAGGAISSILGSTGNHPDYEEGLLAMGAAKAPDHIFAASCYCPITNLDHADMAYEWEFQGIYDYHRMQYLPPKEEGGEPQWIPDNGRMSRAQQEWSDKLATLFPPYVNSLKLKDVDGRALTLDEEGNGSLKEHIKKYVLASAQKEVDKGADLSEHPWITVQDGSVKDVDFKEYVRYRTRMKSTPAFDNVSMGTPENELFGSGEAFARHFTEFSAKNSQVNGAVAESIQIKMMNPMNYIEDEAATKAGHFRIRHGAVDRDTSLAIPVILSTKLANVGIDTDLFLPWGIPHAGDYDLEELFGWIDKICKSQH